MAGQMTRKIIDCRDFPNEIGCTLLISGSAKEVLNIAIRHAIEEHGHKDTTELRKQIKAMMKKDIQIKYKINQTKKKGSKK
jgi:predicted small metal-binding protein